MAYLMNTCGECHYCRTGRESLCLTPGFVAFSHTGGYAENLAYEHVGGKLFQKALDSLAKDGRMVICGGHSGEVVPFDIIPFFRTQKSIIGSFVYERAEVETCVELARQGRITPPVYKTFLLP